MFASFVQSTHIYSIIYIGEHDQAE